MWRQQRSSHRDSISQDKVIETVLVKVKSCIQQRLKHRESRVQDRLGEDGQDSALELRKGRLGEGTAKTRSHLTAKSNIPLDEQLNSC